MYDNTFNGIYGSFHDLDSEFMPQDRQETYELNCKRNINWEYKSIKVHYKFNELGHRCVSPSELGDDYILYTGCSHTLGIGLAKEHTYTDIVATILGKSYYNLSISGSGPDMIFQNVLSFLSYVKKKPSSIVIQWPAFHRFFYINNDRIEFQNASSTEEIWNFMAGNDFANRKNYHCRLILLDILNNMGITNIYEIFDETDLPPSITPASVATKKLFFWYNNPLDFARDVCHPGRLSNIDHANRLLAVM
jgi:hypothetical protein